MKLSLNRYKAPAKNALFENSGISGLIYEKVCSCKTA